MEPETQTAPESQIKVPDSSLPTTAATLIRYVLTALGTLMVTKGILPVDSDVETTVGAILVVISTGYGAWRSYKNNEDKKTMEPYAPAKVATLKSKS